MVSKSKNIYNFIYNKIVLYNFAGKNGFNSILNPFVLSERNIGTDYIDNIL